MLNLEPCVGQVLLCFDGIPRMVSEEESDDGDRNS